MRAIKPQQQQQQHQLIRPSWKLFTAAHRQSRIPNNPLFTKLNNEWTQFALEQRKSTPNKTKRYHLYGQLPLIPHNLLALEEIITSLHQRYAADDQNNNINGGINVFVWYDKEIIQKRFDLTLKPFYAELDSALSAAKPLSDKQRIFQQLVLRWEQRFLDAGIPAHQYLGMLLACQPLMPDLYALDSLGNHYFKRTIPLLSSGFSRQSNNAAAVDISGGVSSKLGSLIDKGLSEIFERKLRAEGLTMRPEDRSWLHQTKQLRHINALLSSVTPKEVGRGGATGSDKKRDSQVQRLVEYLESSTMILGVEEAKRMDGLLAMWQRWRYRQTVDGKVSGAVGLRDYLSRSPTGDPHLFIIPRSHLFAVDKRLQYY